MEQIVRAVASFYDIYYKSLLMDGKSTSKQSIAKQMAFVLLGDFLPQVSTPEIGNYFRRDHSTVVAGRKTLKNEMQVNPKRRAEYETLYRIIEGIEITHVSMYCKKSPAFTIKTF